MINCPSVCTEWETQGHVWEMKTAFSLSYLAHVWSIPGLSPDLQRVIHSSQYLLYTCAVIPVSRCLGTPEIGGCPIVFPLRESVHLIPVFSLCQIAAFLPLYFPCPLLHVFGGMYTRVEHYLTLSLLGFLLLQDLTQPCTVMVSASSKNPREHAELVSTALCWVLLPGVNYGEGKVAMPPVAG